MLFRTIYGLQSNPRSLKTKKPKHFLLFYSKERVSLYKRKQQFCKDNLKKIGVILKSCYKYSGGSVQTLNCWCDCFRDACSTYRKRLSRTINALFIRDILKIISQKVIINIKYHSFFRKLCKMSFKLAVSVRNTVVRHFHRAFFSS